MVMERFYAKNEFIANSSFFSGARGLDIRIGGGRRGAVETNRGGCGGREGV